MENTAVKNSTLKLSITIKILSIIALLGAVIEYLSYRLELTRDGYSLISFNLSKFDHISFLLTIVPVVLFILYVFVFHKKDKSAIILCLMFISLILFFIWKTTNRYIYDYISGYFGGIFIDYYYRSPIYISRIIYLGTNLLCCIFSALAIIGFSKKFNKKLLFIISASVLLSPEALTFLSLITSNVVPTHIEYSNYFSAFANFMIPLGKVSFFTALLLFCIKNNVPSIDIYQYKEIKIKAKVNTKKTTPEQELRLLNDKLSLGIITEEEYKAQRADIISKL